MTTLPRVALGLDFGTESVRALLVDLRGNELASATVKYRHGQVTATLPGSGEKLPAEFALQHPIDWLDASAAAVRKAVKQAKIAGGDVLGIGVDFTSCTMLPALRDGTPLCVTEKFAAQKFAWPKLWKHHGAQRQADRINALARARGEKWLSRYGGAVGLEWFFPKVLETLEHAPAVYDAAEVWLEAGDWFVWQLVGGPAASLPRSTCQAGYKGMWSRETGYPSSAFFKALHPRMANIVTDKMPGRLIAPGERAGELGAAMAKKFGLPAGVPVSAAVIDAHAGVPGAGVAEADTLVMVMGTSSCHMLNSRSGKTPRGVAGIVEDGILPGFFGYETGQAAVGDAFDFVRRLLGHADFDKLTKLAAAIGPGSDGVTCLDWFNGCRTPLMDGSLRGAFVGLGMQHGPGHLYRAAMEASAFGVRWIVDVLRGGGVPVKRFVATGGLPHHNPLIAQIYADVLGEPVAVHFSRQGPALGAAILGVLAAGPEASGFKSAAAAVGAMAGAKRGVKGREPKVVKPSAKARREYDAVYARYRKLAEMLR
jgi:L-ribulokinase